MMDIFRHFLATLAYRFQTAVHGAPEGFGDFQAGNGVRTPSEIVRHMIRLIRLTLHSLESEFEIGAASKLEFGEEVERFHKALRLLDNVLADPEFQQNRTHMFQFLQGPLSDAMTHVGQLAMLRRMAGGAIPGENFMVADIAIGKVDADQNLAPKA